MTNRDNEGGFSLLEVLVAIAVLAVAASTILSAAESHVRIITGVTERTHARWIAENHLARLQSRKRTETQSEVTMAGRSWVVDTQRSDTADPDLERVDIAVSGHGAVAQLTAFIPRLSEAAQ